MKRALGIVVALLLVAGLWVYSQLGAVRWREAYAALGVQPMGSSKLALLEATVDGGEPPEGLTLGDPIHPRGSLVRLRYDVLDAGGGVVASHEVRALVPALPFVGADAPGSEFDRIECTGRCPAELAATGGVSIQRGGRAGLPDEWVLRLPKDVEFSLGRRSLELQDIAAAQSRRYPEAPTRVTLLEACPATVRFGESTDLEFLPIPLPIPRGLSTTRWLQLEGCTAMMNAPPAAEPEAAVLVADASTPVFIAPWQTPASWDALRPMQTGGTFRAALIVDEAWLTQRGKPRVFHLLRACRYQPGTREWTPLPPSDGDAEIAVMQLPAPDRRIAYRFPEDAALYFAEWTELEGGVAGTPHRIAIPSGVERCRDDAGKARDGEILTCVPGASNALAESVPDPEKHCPAPPPAR